MKGVDPKVSGSASPCIELLASWLSFRLGERWHADASIQFRRNQRWAQLGTQKAVAAMRKEKAAA